MMMQALNLGHFLTSSARASALVLIWYALFLPFYGALLDHHFAERQAAHEHLYLGRIVPGHVHPYQVSHTHLHWDEAESTGPQDLFNGDHGPDGIVFLTSHDGMSQGSDQLTVPSMHLSLDFPSTDDTGPTFGIPAGDKILQAAFLALPKKPPRV